MKTLRRNAIQPIHTLISAVKRFAAYLRAALKGVPARERRTRSEGDGRKPAETRRAQRALYKDIAVIEGELRSISSQLPELLELTARAAPLSGHSAHLDEICAITERLKSNINTLARFLDAMDDQRLTALSAFINLSAVATAVSSVAALLTALYRSLPHGDGSTSAYRAHMYDYDDDTEARNGQTRREAHYASGRLVSSITYLENKACPRPLVFDEAAHVRGNATDNVIRLDGTAACDPADPGCAILRLNERKKTRTPGNDAQ